jgi:hypothetical protein
MILSFLQRLIAVSQSHDMPVHAFLGVVHFVYELWKLREQDKDEAYGLLSVLARGFVGAEIPEAVVSAVCSAQQLQSIIATCKEFVKFWSPRSARRKN